MGGLDDYELRAGGKKKKRCGKTSLCGMLFGLRLSSASWCFLVNVAPNATLQPRDSLGPSIYFFSLFFIEL